MVIHSIGVNELFYRVVVFIQVVLIVDAPGLEVTCGENALSRCSVFSCDCIEFAIITH